MASTSAQAVRRRFFDDLVRCETRLYNAVGERLRAEHGIVASQFEMLRYLRDHPGARVAEMASTFAAGIGAISKGVDRLTARGWATREPNPADGRSSLIVLTDDGAALVAEAERTFDRVLADLVGPTLDEGELAAGASALAVLRRALEAARVGVPTG
ncbi:MAG: MarR family winged helix-turn-helix transcriptional regulator [Nocardioides sp.]